MYIEEFLVIAVAIALIMVYRNYKGENVNKFITNQVSQVYDRFAPYSYKTVQAKVKELGQEYTPKDYAKQVAIISGLTAVISYLYFYNLLISIIYVIISIMFVPYLTYLKSKRIYSEFIFEQIQTYTSNIIMEFATTQSFVKSLEGVVASGVLEDPVLKDVQEMIDMSYRNGTIDEALEMMSAKYPYYIVKNTHNLFLQITKEGAQNSADALDNMQLDIDMLIESVYRDRIERSSFHKNFLTFGVTLYLLVMLVQYLLGRESYIKLVEKWYIQFLLHAIIVINTYFLIKGEKYYNENVGAE